MDTHIKYTIKKRHNQNTPYRIDYGNITRDMEDSLLFEFEEYEEVYIKFDYDKNKGSIFIDTHDSEGKLLCNSNEYMLINMPRKENSLVPGYFEVKIQYEYNRIYYYKVKPKNIEWCELLNLRKILDRYVRGICSNFNLSKSAYSYDNCHSILDYYQNQYNLWREIKSSIKLLMNNPKGEYEKVYGYYYKPNKIDLRTIRAMSKNNGEKLISKYYTYKQNINYNTTDNMILYNKLLEYRNTLKRNHKNTIKFYEVEYKKLQNLNIEYKNKQEELNNIKNNNILSERYKSSIENRVSYLRISKYDQNEKLKIIKKVKTLMNRILLEVEDIIFEMQENLNLDKYNHKPILLIKNYKYKEIIWKLDKIIINPKYKRDLYKKEEALIFRFKKTEVLFEYLCFIRSIEVILSMGFYCQSGWFEKVINREYDMEIPSECNNCFVKDNINIIVTYDKEAPNKLEDDYEGLYSFNSRHRRPDISILIYKNNQFVKALILEVKCRNSRYIYSKQGDTSVIDTMKDYSQLCYYNGKIKKDAIDKVTILYPNQKNNIILENNELIDIFSFIPININDDLDYELYKEIERFIEEYSY